jgi:hypothetical protein
MIGGINLFLREERTQLLRKGISGWLSPEGKFIPADYGNHARIALDLEVNGSIKPIVDRESGKLVHGERLLELLGYIKLVCRFAYGNVVESHVFFPQQFGCKRDITDSQKRWLETNCEKMSSVQEFYIKQFLY